MFTMLRSIPNLIGAKVEIKFLHFDAIIGDVETEIFDQAIIDNLIYRQEIKILDLTLSNCFIGKKRVPGVHRYDRVVTVEHLHILEEGHSNVEWEPKPILTPRQKILERLRILAKEKHQSNTDDDDDDWDVPSTFPTKQRLSARLKKDRTPDPSPCSSPPTEQHYPQRLANLSGTRPKVVTSIPTKSQPQRPLSIHKFTKTFGSEQLNILPLTYHRHDQLTVQEGKLVEYKGHRSFTIEQLSVRAKHTQSRRHISPVACGMINNEDGGIILMGVQDNGLIDGLMLSKAQQEHVVTNIIDTFDRYQPKVPRHFYEINFIRVKLTKDSNAKEDTTHQTDENPLPHLLRTTKLCWCDHRAISSINLGFLHKCWIIELRIHPRDNSDPRTIRFMRSATFIDKDRVFLTETGKAYYRLKDVTKRVH
jgi:hypothetical protein